MLTNPDFHPKTLARIPLYHVGEIADLLAGSSSVLRRLSLMTGTFLTIDGGWTAVRYQLTASGARGAAPSPVDGILLSIWQHARRGLDDRRGDLDGQ